MTEVNPCLCGASCEHRELEQRGGKKFCVRCHRQIYL